MLKVLGNSDPYATPDADFFVHIGNFPAKRCPGIVKDLVFSPSPFFFDIVSV